MVLDGKKPTGRHLHSFAVLGFLCLTVFGSILFAGSDKILAGYDILVYHFYARAFTLESLLMGTLPKWNPYEYGGMPFAADPGNCVFYPFNKLFLFMPISKAIGINLVLHVLFAGAGMLLLAQSVGLKRGGALVAGMVFMLSGYFVDRVAAGHEILVMCSAYLPWIFLCYERASQKGARHWCLAGGALGALQVLTGASQPVLYTALFVLLYATVKNLQGVPGSRWSLLLRDLKYLVLMGALGAGLSAVQLIPSAELVARSARAQTSLDFVGSFSFPPQNLLHLLIPYVNVGTAISNWEYSCYVGILPLALALAALGSLPGREARAFAAVGALSLLIMLGSYTPVFPLLVKSIPGLSLFRVHARAELGLVLVLAVLAGAGWDMVFDAESERIRKRLALITGGFAAVVLAVVVLVELRWMSLTFDRIVWTGTLGSSGQLREAIDSVANPRILRPISLALLAFLAGIALVFRNGRRARVLLGMTIVLDLCLASWGRFTFLDVSVLTREDPLVRLVRDSPAGGYSRVWLPLRQFFASRAKFFKIFAVNGHNALALRDFELYLETLTGISPVRRSPSYEMDPRVFMKADGLVHNILNVQYFWIDDRIARSTDVLPRAFFVDAYVVGRTEEPAQADVRRMVTLEEEPPPGAYGGAGDAGEARVRIDSYSNDAIELSLNAPSDGFVVLSEVYYPGWRAEVDGAEVRILRGNLLLRVVPVKRGTHRVRLLFAPRSLLLGEIVTLLTLLALGGLLVYRRAHAATSTTEPPPGRVAPEIG
jgi:hypothetical protein